MKINKIISVLKIPLPFLYGSTLSYDRWRWIKRNIPRDWENKRLIDLGCGRGTYMFGLSKNNNVLGLTLDREDINEANKRKDLFEIENCEFRKVDLRKLNKEKDLINSIDIAICSEVIEHIINDEKLLKDIFEILKKEGTLLLTAPYHKNANINREPLMKKESGGHVRLGYNEIVFKEILLKNGFIIKKIGYCSGILSQLSNTLLDKMSTKNYLFSRLLIIPIKLIYPIFDKITTNILKKEFASICIVVKKKNAELCRITNKEK